ncbi:MAG: hypothetical protein M3A44_09830 [Gammaproteobacteria bacterium]
MSVTPIPARAWLNGRSSKAKSGQGKMRALWWFMVALYISWVWMGFVEFEIWPQVLELWGRETDITDLILHPHGLRYALVLPIFLLSDLTGFSTNWLFSQLVALLIIFIAVNVTDTARMLLHSRKSWGLLITASAFFMVLSGFMHGRIAFALMGMALLLHTMVAWDHRLLGSSELTARVLLAFFLASVSSGTFIVVIITFYGWWCCRILGSLGQGRLSVRDWRVFLLFGMAMLMMLPLLDKLMMKNLDFYGDGFDGLWDMLTHGAGIIFHIADWVVVVLSLVVLALFIMFAVVLGAFFPIVRLPAYATVISLVGGMFGYSTLVMAIPPVMMLGMVSFEHLKFPRQSIAEPWKTKRGREAANSPGVA